MNGAASCSAVRGRCRESLKALNYLKTAASAVHRRWADRAEIAAVTRGSWVWPSAAETPPRAEVVEGGAY